MKGDINVLAQLISSMQDAAFKLEKAKEQNRIEDFNKLKNFILHLQEQISNEFLR